MRYFPFFKREEFFFEHTTKLYASARLYLIGVIFTPLNSKAFRHFYYKIAQLL